MIKTLLQKFFNVKGEEDMVKYWKSKLAVEAKVTTDETGSYIMWMEGEKYPFPGFPRGVVLFKSLSKLKHEIKNQIFNDSWYGLEDGKSEEQIIGEVKEKLFTTIKSLMDERRLLLLPPERMASMPRELWRAMTVLEKRHKSDHIRVLKEVLCFVANEDDAYRMRMQDFLEYMRPKTLGKRIYRWFGLWKDDKMIEDFDIGLGFMEHTEIVGDMKERQRLLRRILVICLKDKRIRQLFLELCREWDWNKMYLTKGDRYFLRGKWYKVDYRNREY